MRIGYARTSTVDQVAGYEAQIRDLEAAGCTKIFREQLSSVDASRPQLEAAIDYCRDDDILVCTKLDRLARSVSDLVKIEEKLKARGASILIMDPAMDTSTPNGRLIFNIIASIAQFEREIMLTRQREGIAKAQREGKYIGRAPTAMGQSDEVLARLASGQGPAQIAEEVGVSRASVYRIKAADPADIARMQERIDKLHVRKIGKKANGRAEA